MPSPTSRLFQSMVTFLPSCHFSHPHAAGNHLSTRSKSAISLKRSKKRLKEPLKVCCGVAVCAATVFCRRPLSSARWLARRACATDPAAGQRPSTAAWMNLDPVSGMRSSAVQIEWEDLRSCLRYSRRLIGTKLERLHSEMSTRRLLIMASSRPRTLW